MRTTQEVIEAMYAAFLAGDKDGMLAVMHDDVEVRFLGQAEVHGKAAANAFFDFAGGCPARRTAERKMTCRERALNTSFSRQTPLGVTGTAARRGWSFMAAIAPRVSGSAEDSVPPCER